MFCAEHASGRYSQTRLLALRLAVYGKVAASKLVAVQGLVTVNVRLITHRKEEVLDAAHTHLVRRTSGGLAGGITVSELNVLQHFIAVVLTLFDRYCKHLRNSVVYSPGAPIGLRVVGAGGEFPYAYELIDSIGQPIKVSWRPLLEMRRVAPARRVMSRLMDILVAASTVNCAALVAEMSAWWLKRLVNSRMKKLPREVVGSGLKTSNPTATSDAFRRQGRDRLPHSLTRSLPSLADQTSGKPLDEPHCPI